MKIEENVTIPTAVVPATTVALSGPAGSSTLLANSGAVGPSHDQYGPCPMSLSVEVTNVSTKKCLADSLHKSSKEDNPCSKNLCLGSKMRNTTAEDPRTTVEILEEAFEFIEQHSRSLDGNTEAQLCERFEEIRVELEKTGTYTLTLDELEFGAKTAWRNASRCIGRLHWTKLNVQDCRHIETTEQMFEAVCNHLRSATNGGNIRSFITVFPQRIPHREDFRVWNPQLISFAGYQKSDGTVFGDGGNVEFTKVCMRLGWKGKGTCFDVLPLVVSAPDEGPKFYEIPEDLILFVELEHPKYAWFAELGLKWYCLPAVSNMLFDVGGLEFTAAPFNGWYMGTEIGARDFCDPHRYNMAEMIAKKLGLDTSVSSSLWKDQVLVDVNIAVLHSFRKKGVTIVDHHAASESFVRHLQNEHNSRGGCPADWVWIVPPMSASVTPVFHQEMVNYKLKPSYEYQADAWTKHSWLNVKPNSKRIFVVVARAIAKFVILLKRAAEKPASVTILYATETGKSEAFAHKLGKLMHVSFQVQVSCMTNYSVEKLSGEKILLAVASTFGSGEPPDNGKNFLNDLQRVQSGGQVDLSGLQYSVFALGSSQYNNFCAFGKHLDQVLHQLGAQRFHDVGLGDEMEAQETSFVNWCQPVYSKLCASYGVSTTLKLDFKMVAPEGIYDPSKVRLRVVPDVKEDSSYVLHQLSKIHRKDLFLCDLASRRNLLPEGSERQIALVKLAPSNRFLKTWLSYEPGDHLGAIPSNSPEMVDFILKYISKFRKVEMYNTVYQIELCTDDVWSPCKRLPPCSVRTALLHYLDISNSPSPEILKHLSEMANDARDRLALKKLSEDSEEYKKWRTFYCPTLVDVLRKFRSLHVTPKFLVTHLPLLQPRLYSISNSQKCCSEQVDLTIRVVSYSPPANAENGNLKHGVCSNYLCTWPPKEVACFVRACHAFRLPQNSSVPIILIAAGSGIAPFRAFWQQRMWEAEHVGHCGKMLLFYGCRNEGENIYKEELQSLLNRGIMAEVFLAKSREPGEKKRYVQDVVLVQSGLIHWLIEKEEAHIYVCGETAMAEDVKNSIVEIIMSRGNVNRTEADLVLQKLKDQERYHEDVFGARLG